MWLGLALFGLGFVFGFESVFVFVLAFGFGGPSPVRAGCVAASCAPAHSRHTCGSPLSPRADTSPRARSTAT